MPRILTVNGVGVESNKPVASIINSMVFFEDGSWCDVATGEIHNVGPGEIHIGDPQGGDDKEITEGPKSYAAESLDVRDVVADVEVRVNHNKGIEVTITGPTSNVKAIRVEVHGTTLCIVGQGGMLKSGGVTISGRNNRVTTIGNIRASRLSVSGSIVIGSGITINGGGGRTKILVRVPARTSVGLSDITGESNIGDTEGDLRVVSTGSDDVNVGNVAKADIIVGGSGDVSVDRVNGELNMSLTGSGEVNVSDGNVALLRINSTGSGDATFRGRAENAILTSTGSGDIRVAFVEHQPRVKKTGSGDIRVKNWR